MQQPLAEVPLWLALPYTAFLVVLVPVYLAVYGPTNFLYFCDFALILTLISLWTGNMLCASAAAVGILLPQSVWIADFVAGLFGFELTGITDYMHSDSLSLFVRLLSLFHVWLPLLLVYLLWRRGYDSRAIWLWWPLGTALLVLSYLVSARPPAPADNPNLPVNINYVFGWGDAGPQAWLPPQVSFIALLVLTPVVIYWPTHLLLLHLFQRGRLR